jgi:hypothetical protein
MSKNISTRALALGSAFALAFTGISALPAAAAVGDVTLTPTSGANYGAFSTDAFSLDADVTTLISPNNLAYKIVNPDQEVLEITIEGGGSPELGLSIAGYTDLGVAVDLDSIDDSVNNNNGQGSGVGDDLGQPAIATGTVQINFAGLGISSIVIFATSVQAATNSIAIKPRKTTGADYVYKDGSPSAITVQAWVEAEASPDYKTVDAAYASPVRTVTWVDPAAVSVIPTIERFQESGGTNRLNDATTGGNVAMSLQFANSNLNLDQVDISKWDFKIGNSDDAGYDNVSTIEPFVDGDKKLNSGQTTHDASGKIFAVLTDDTDGNITLDSTKDYIVSVKSDGASSVYFASAAFAPAANSAAVDQIEATVTSKTDALQADADTQAIKLRAGSKAFTYTAQTKTTDDTNSTASSIQVLAVVKSGAFLTTDGGLTVSGSPSAITKKNQAVLVTGFTDSKGQYSVTVTSKNAAASESYTVQFFVLDGTDDKFDSILNSSTVSIYTATYEAATATTLKTDATVLSGASVTASFTVVDQFDQATNMSGTKAVSIELKASNAAKLDKDAVVAANGTASFTFDNYVTTGSADVITATTYTGSATSPTTLSGSLVKVLTLYNAIDGAAVQVPETATGVITYDDFITGKTTVAAPAPNDGTFTYTGTVVDANGSGVPAASVTIAADGFQFLGSGSTSYVQDEITVSANAAGVFTVSMWSHVVATDGVDVTVTSGTNTATTLVKTYLPENLSAGNLAFKLNLPAVPLMNTTYVVTASLADKWGNPVATSANVNDNGVKFIGVGSVEINSVSDSVEKNFDKTGTATVFLRSIKDIAGPGSVTATMEAASYTYWTGSATATDQLIITEVLTDVKTTAWDETSYEAEIASNVEIYETAADAPTAVSAKKVNAGSFKGYVALYALGYEGQRMSAKVGNDWIIVPSIPARTNDLFRAVDFVGAGVDISVRVYIDRVLLATIPLLTK